MLNAVAVHDAYIMILILFTDRVVLHFVDSAHSVLEVYVVWFIPFVFLFVKAMALCL